MSWASRGARLDQGDVGREGRASAGARFYRLAPTGERVLVRQRQIWDEFVEAVRLVTRGEHA